MKRFLAPFALLLALLSISVPGLAAAAKGLALHPAPVVVLQANGSYAKAPCALGGANRLLACPSDIGVLPLSRSALTQTRSLEHPMRHDRPRRGIATVPHLPPPKTA